MHLHDLLSEELAGLRRRKNSDALDILETGSIRGDSGEYLSNDGWSTLLFAKHIRKYGGSFVSVDLNVEVAQRVLDRHGLADCATFTRGHSIDVLARLLYGTMRFDLIYLDSDNDADLILHEYFVARMLLRSPGLILVDDVDLESTGVVKGHALVPYLEREGVNYRLETREGDSYSTGILAIETTQNA